MNKERKQNIDVTEGFMYPINAKEQGEVFEKIKPFMNHMRYHQLIKNVKYTVTIEYYPEETEYRGKKDE